MKDLYNFEKNLKTKLDEQEFPFDEKNWEKARVMIDASRNNRNPWMLYSLSAVVIMLCTGLFYYFSSETSSVKPETLLAMNDHPVRNYESNVNTLSSDNNSEPANEMSGNNTISSNNHPISPVNHQVQSVGPDKITSLQKYKSTDRSEMKSDLNKTSQSSSLINTNASGNSNSAHAETAETTKAKATGSAGKENSIINQVNEKSKVKNQDQIKSNSSTEIPAVLGNNSLQTVKNSIVHSGVVNGNANKPGAISTSTGTTPENKTTVTDSVGHVTTDTYLEMTINPSDTGSIIPLLKTDTTAVASLATNSETPYKVKQTKSILYSELGATYLLGWNSGESHEASGFNVLAGFNYQYFINSVVSIGIGVQYNNINHLTNSSYSVCSVKYDFGVQKEITSIKYIRLDYITLPVKIGFNAGKNNTFGAGANFSTLINSDSRYEKYLTNNSEPMNESNRLSTKKEKGYLTGFSAYDIQVSAFYRRTIYKGFSVKAELVYGLTDIKKNAHFNSNNFERSTGAKLSICYDLFKK